MRSPAVPLGALLIAMLAACCPTAVPTSPPPTQPAETTPVGLATPGTSAAPTRRTILVDTDVAADDLVALAFLVASQHVDIAAITVSGTGEAHCTAGVDVVLRLLDRLDAPELPVACGRETPLAGTHSFPDEWREHVDGGSGLDLPSTDRTPSSSTALELITQLSKEHPGLHVLATGPLTNLADAMLTDPDLAERLGPVFVMGGALYVPGNLACCGAPEDNDVAEWNIYVDPHAANVVIDSGVMPSFVSLDGTNQVPLSKPYGQRVIDTAEGVAARLVAELFTANPFMIDGTFYLWDPLAAQLAAGYPIGSFEPACIEVEESEGPESGFTRPGCDTPNIQYLAAVDATTAEETLLSVLNGA